MILLLFNILAILAYAIVVAPKFWVHVLGPAAIAVVVPVSLVIVDLSDPFSGSVTVSPDSFKAGILARFFARPCARASASPLGG